MTTTTATAARESAAAAAADFDRLTAPHRDAVYRQMVRLCGNADDAEDVLSEALLKAYRALPELHDPDALRGWLAVIARRTCTRLRRREGMHPVLALADLPGGDAAEPADRAPRPEEQVVEAETRACVHAVIDGLPEPYRRVYELRDVEGLTAPEAAERLGISVAAVKSRLHRARAQVRAGLDRALGCLGDDETGGGSGGGGGGAP